MTCLCYIVSWHRFLWQWWLQYDMGKVEEHLTKSIFNFIIIYKDSNMKYTFRLTPWRFQLWLASAMSICFPFLQSDISFTFLIGWFFYISVMDQIWKATYYLAGNKTNTKPNLFSSLGFLIRVAFGGWPSSFSHILQRTTF